MDENEQKQQLSIAYLHAVTSAAGFPWQATAVDNDSVDRTFRLNRKLSPAWPMRPKEAKFQWSCLERTFYRWTRCAGSWSRRLDR